MVCVVAVLSFPFFSADGQDCDLLDSLAYLQGIRHHQLGLFEEQRSCCLVSEYCLIQKW